MANGNDQELLQIFIEEATDLIASLSGTLLAFGSDLSNLDKIADLKRDLHTLKGSARMVGQMDIGDLAHETETLCEAIAKKEILIDKSIFDLINLCQDRVALMVERLKNNEAPTKALDLLERLQKLSKSSTPSNHEKIEEVLKPLPKHHEEKIKEDNDQKTVTSSTEVIRVKAQLLETLTNLSTESSMIRVGLEQHIGTLGNFLSEMKQETKRLEGQLNTLNSEIQHYASSNRMVKGDSRSIETYSYPEKQVDSLEQISHIIRETTFDLINVLKSLTGTHVTMENLVLNQARIGTELQHRLSDTRLIPFESIVPRLSRIARQVAMELNKQIDFKVLKSSGEMDRTVLERLIPSLEHILRNAIDHGIESGEERKKKGKPATGKIEVSFTRIGSIAAIEVKDDGGGIDGNVVREKAIKLGLLPADKIVSDEEILRYILVPGFSTKEAITQISGRGVGMDVVNTAINEMGGTIVITSLPGQGTAITIRFPFTASLNRVLIFSVQGQTFGMVLTNISGVIQVERKELKRLFSEENPTFHDKERSYLLHYMGSLLEAEDKELNIPKRKTYPVILFASGECPVALVVDNVMYSREFVVQALGGQFKLTNEYSGGTLLGDGKVVLILDPYNLSAKAKNFMGKAKMKVEFSKGKSSDSEGKMLIMVVDDSVSVRAVTQRLLERNQYRVITAKDGLDALQILERETPQLILLDLDMPRMDGFEFATNARREEKYKSIPIVVISSRTLEPQKKRAEELGLNGFLKKPYQESELLTMIQEILGEKE